MGSRRLLLGIAIVRSTRMGTNDFLGAGFQISFEQSSAAKYIVFKVLLISDGLEIGKVAMAVLYKLRSWRMSEIANSGDWNEGKHSGKKIYRIFTFSLRNQKLHSARFFPKAMAFMYLNFHLEDHNFHFGKKTLIIAPLKLQLKKKKIRV